MPIPFRFTKYNTLFTLLDSTEHAALYSRHSQKTGKLLGYDVYRILTFKTDHTWPTGKITPAGTPFLPSSEQWGTYAWSYQTLDRAQARYKTLTTTLCNS